MSTTTGGTDAVSTDSPIELVANAFNQASATDGPRVGIAAAAFMGLALFTILGFELIRSNNKMVYEPKRKYPEPGKPQPPALSYTPFAWIGPVWRYTDEDLLPLIGLDAVTFLRFLRMVAVTTTILAVLLCAVLFPVDIAWHLANKPGGRNSWSFLNMISIASVRGASIWAHVAMSYVATGIVLFFIFINYKRMVRLRWEFFRSEEYQNSFHARTIMLTNVPRKLQSDQALSTMLSNIGMPYPTTGVNIGRVVGALPDLIKTHEETVRKLEKVLAKYLKNPDKLPAKRPTVTVGKTGCCGGKEVDAIDFYVGQINKIEAAIDNWRQRIADKKPESYGFASLASVPYAHAAAKSLRGKKQAGIEMTLAPHPNDVLWDNLSLSKGQRRRSSCMGFLYLSVLLFINAVPLLGVALISQMSSFVGLLGFLGSWQRSSNWTFSAVAGLAPPAISGIMGFFLPILMRRIAKYRGIPTRSKLNRTMLGQYFAFLVVSQFIFFTLIGVTLTTVGAIVGLVGKKSAGDIFAYLGNNTTTAVESTYIQFSSYWLTWIPLRGYLAFFDLAQILKLMLVWVQNNFLGRTPRDIREYSKPPHFDFPIYYANLLFLFAVAMLYACLAPLVVAFAAIAFWFSLVVYKYQLMYVHTTKVESGGSMWRPVVNRLLVCLVFMQIILALALVLNGTGGGAGALAWIRVVASLPPIIIVIAFKLWCRSRFDTVFDWYIPTNDELASTKVHTGDVRHHRLQRRFGHPALYSPLFTPMVHAKVKHLLADVFRGRLESAGMHDVDGRKVETEEVEGGLRIAAIEEDQLEYDPRMDSDNRSIISSTTLGMGRPGAPSRQGTGTLDYQAYYAGGPMGRPSYGGEEFEMGRVGGAHDSRENLLEKVGMPGAGRGHAPRYSDHTLQGSVASHGKQPSTGSWAPPGAGAQSPGGIPGLELPPTTMYQQPSQAYGSTGDLGYGPQPGGYYSAPPPAAAAAAYYAAPAPGAAGARPAPRHQNSQGSLGAMYASTPMYTPPEGNMGGAGAGGAGGYFTSSPQGSPHLMAQQMYTGGAPHSARQASSGQPYGAAPPRGPRGPGGPGGYPQGPR